MSYKIIDISHHNTVEDLHGGINGVMIRATYGKVGLDSKLHEHVELAEKAGIPYGFYFYSYALNTESAKIEVQNFLDNIKMFRPTLPCAIDMEDADGYKKRNGFPDVETLCEICNIACSEIEKAGYYALIYASDSWFRDYLFLDRLDKYGKWVARWSNEAPNAEWQMWQYTSTGQVVGIKGNVDISTTNYNFPKIIANMQKKNRVESVESSDNLLMVGDKVKVTSRYDYDNTKCASFVLNNVYTVMQIKEDRIVIGLNGIVTGAWNVKDIVKYYG